MLPGAIIRSLSEEEMAAYRAPFAEREARLPTLIWPRQASVDGEPEDVTAIVRAYAEWLSQSEMPKLFVSRRTRSGYRGGQRKPAVLPDLEKPARGHRERTALPAGGLARRDRCRTETVRNRNAPLGARPSRPCLNKIGENP